jgi:hypothetical protein
VVAIAAGQNHSCALLSSGAVQCWGSDSDGQLGSGSSDPDVPLPPDSNVPVQVTGLTGGVQSIATGYQHSCAATTTGSAFCWGSNGADEIAIDQSTGGTKIGAPHQIPDVVVGGCADGTDEQVFNNAMVGCAGTVTFDNRATLCAAGYQPATAVQWVSNRGGGVPLHNYWTNDPLLWAGGGTSSCYVSLSVGQTSCNGMPMRICTGSGSDPEGNVCNWQHCGLYTNTPDSFFGGCFSNQTAGTACIPTGAPANACTSVKSCPKWENGITLDPMTGTALEPTTTFGNGVRHLQCTSTNHGLSCDAPPTIRGTIDGPEPLACEAAASARLTQLQTDVANSVALETNFDSMAALNARSAQAQASVSATRGGNTIQQFNFISTPVGPPNNPNGLLLLQWDERWMCQVNTVNAKPTSAPNDACGCNN